MKTRHNFLGIAALLLAIGSCLLPAARAAQSISSLTLTGTSSLAGTITDAATVNSSGAHTFLTASTVTFNAGSTLTLNGAFAGTPTGGTLSLANITLTLPSSFTGVVLGANGGTGIANTGKTITLGGNLTTSGAFATTLTATATTTLTLPTTGTLSTLAGTETLTNKSIDAGQLTGTVVAARMPAFTGDITTSAGAVATTLATVNSNVGTFGSATATPAITLNGKGLATAASNVTITPAVGSITGLGTGVATFLATPSSANMISAINDETGSGAIVFANTPTLVTPVIGAATGTSLAASGNITSSGGILSAGTASPSSTNSAGIPQITAESDLYSSVASIAHNNTDGNYGLLMAGKSRGTKASPLIIATTDRLGSLDFFGYDGAAYRTSAQIVGIIDGTPGASDLPTGLSFRVSADGSATPVQGMYLSPAGNLTVSGTGAHSFAGPTAFKGTTTNDNAATGYVGEYVSSTATGLSSTSNVILNVTSIVLTAGDWDVTGQIHFAGDTVTGTQTVMSLSETSGAHNFTIGRFSATPIAQTATTQITLSVPSYRFSTTGTTIYLVSRQIYSAGTPSISGLIAARRVR